MSESKFTPAPWIKSGIADKIIVYSKNNELIAKVSREFKGDSETQANAILIASAPEMYNILQSMAENDFELTESMCLEARRVIKKAIGK